MAPPRDTDMRRCAYGYALMRCLVAYGYALMACDLLLALQTLALHHYGYRLMPCDQLLPHLIRHGLAGVGFADCGARLASLLAQQGRLVEAQDLFDEALEAMQEDDYGSTEPSRRAYAASSYRLYAKYSVLCLSLYSLCVCNDDKVWQGGWAGRMVYGATAGRMVHAPSTRHPATTSSLVCVVWCLLCDASCAVRVTLLVALHV